MIFILHKVYFIYFYTSDRVQQKENNLDTPKKSWRRIFFGPYLGLQAELGESRPIFGISTRFCVEWATEHPHSPKSTFDQFWTLAPITQFFPGFWSLLKTPESNLKEGLKLQGTELLQHCKVKDNWIPHPRFKSRNSQNANSKVTDYKVIHRIVEIFKSWSTKFKVASLVDHPTTVKSSISGCWAPSRALMIDIRLYSSTLNSSANHSTDTTPKSNT